MKLKGLSGIVATIILIALVTIASIAIYFIATTPISPNKDSIEAPLIVEAVKSSDSTMTIYVRNLGDREIKVTSIYIIDPKTRSVTYAVTGLNLKVPPKSVKALMVNVNKSIKGYYMIKVSSTTATTAMTYYINLIPVGQGVDTFKVKVCSEDPNPGFLAEKMDKEIFEVASGEYVITIKDQAITSSKIASNSITSEHIADGSITSDDIADESITGADIAPNSITGSHIADNSITGADIADESITSKDIKEVAWSKVDKTGSSLLDLGDTPSEYKGYGGCYLRVKRDEKGIEFEAIITSMVRAHLKKVHKIETPNEWTTLVYDVKDVDLGDEYNEEKGVFIPKEAGWYIVYAQAAFEYADKGFRWIGIFKNGKPYSYGLQMTARGAGGKITRVNIYDLVWLDKGDRLEIRVYSSEVEALVLGTDQDEYGTFMVIYKLPAPAKAGKV